jgi:hypothetical protein
VTGLSWSDTSTLTWNASEQAVAYHVYRGHFSEFGAPSMGECRNDLDLNSTDTKLSDPEAPLSNEGFLYLITARDDSGAASTTGLSGCAERSVSTICAP